MHAGAGRVRLLIHEQIAQRGLTRNRGPIKKGDLSLNKRTLLIYGNLGGERAFCFAQVPLFLLED